ncbi:MAG: MBL fold metallo-hydrolase [Pseudomonadota bacterium]
MLPPATNALPQPQDVSTQHEVAIAAGELIVLSPRVTRITAPNAGMMTGPGTNSYLLIGRDNVVCVDPGPADEQHLAALLHGVAASGKPLTHILLTHTHRDHSPGCAALVAATGARVLGMSPLASDPSQDRDTVIDQTLREGELFDALGWPLQVIHTPGHVENHLCFHAPEDGWLITGDHLIQGSTVVIIPPHGRLGDYLASLRKLLPLQLTALLPGHGRVMADANSVINGTLAHRQQREDKVLRCLPSTPLPLADLVLTVYDDVAPWLHGIAKYSLLAHLIKLAEENRATESAEGWQAVQVN